MIAVKALHTVTDRLDEHAGDADELAEEIYILPNGREHAMNHIFTHIGVIGKHAVRQVNFASKLIVDLGELNGLEANEREEEIEVHFIETCGWLWCVSNFIFLAATLGIFNYDVFITHANHCYIPCLQRRISDSVLARTP